MRRNSGGKANVTCVTENRFNVAALADSSGPRADHRARSVPCVLLRARYRRFYAVAKGRGAHHRVVLRTEHSASAAAARGGRTARREPGTAHGCARKDCSVCDRGR